MKRHVLTKRCSSKDIPFNLPFRTEFCLTTLRLLEFEIGAELASLPLPTINAPQIQQLSSTPTFDCAKARSATARIICLDQAGANADWDLISAYWARYGALGEDGQKAF